MRSVSAFLRRLWHADAPLTSVGVGMFGLLLATLVALVLDPRTIGGAPAWLKPAKFAASIGIYTLTLAWVFTWLPEWTRTRRIVSWVTVLTLVIEIVIIDAQAWRGHPSHFNIETPLDGLLFNIMGIAILVQTLSAMAVTVALWRQRVVDRPMGWAVRLGMTITVIGALSGGLMIPPSEEQRVASREGPIALAGGHAVGGPDGGPGLPGTGWSVEYGDLRVAHFVGLHAVQAVPLLTWLLIGDRPGAGTSGVSTVFAISALYVALYALLLWQALRGQSIVNPDRMMVGLLGAWVAAFAGAVALTRRSA